MVVKVATLITADKKRITSFEMIAYTEWPPK